MAVSYSRLNVMTLGKRNGLRDRIVATANDELIGANGVPGR
jgi:hypothetical protein